MAAASKIWEKVLDLLSLDRRGLQGEGLDPALASGSALHSASRAPICHQSIFGLTTWTCFGNEAADDLLQTSIDSAPRTRASF